MRVHQASKLGKGRTLCGRELAKLPSGARVLARAGDVAAADVTCRVCLRHRPWEERALAEVAAVKQVLGAAATPDAPPCPTCGSTDTRPASTGQAGRACNACGAVFRPLELLSSRAPGAMDRAIGALYRRAVEYIACNDDPASLELAAIRALPSVALVAHVWGTSVDAVARFVLRLRSYTPFSG